MLRTSAAPVTITTIRRGVLLVPHHAHSTLTAITPRGAPYRPRPQSERGLHNMQAIGMPRAAQREIGPRKPPIEPYRPLATSGDYSKLGTDSEEYHCLDTDPMSETSPYEHPRTSGRQLRYGGMRPLRGPWEGSWKEPVVEMEFGNQRIGRIL